MTIHHSNLYARNINTWKIDWGKKPRVLSGQCPCYPARCIFNLVCLCWPIINQSIWIPFSSHPVGTRRCYDVESTSLTLTQRHWRWFNGAATPCAQCSAHELVPTLNKSEWIWNPVPQAVELSWRHVIVFSAVRCSIRSANPKGIICSFLQVSRYCLLDLHGSIMSQFLITQR